MPAKITLTVTNGTLQGEQYLFEERTTCIMGRAEDCHLRLPNDEYHSNVSRYHCLLDINPPQIRIRDFGSKNGTYINGSIIGQREAHQTPEEAANLTFPEHDLGAGDEIQLGDTVLCVAIETEGNAIPLPVEPVMEQEEPATSKAESHQGKTYSVPHHLLHPPQPPSNRSKFFQLIQGLLKRAMGGDETLKDIKHYTMERKLGQGGFGEVYLARHTLTNKQVALKVMQPAIAAEQWAIDRFQREIENTKALNHANIIQLLEHGFADGLFFFTMEYCNGELLRS